MGVISPPVASFAAAELAAGGQDSLPLLVRIMAVYGA